MEMKQQKRKKRVFFYSLLIMLTINKICLAQDRQLTYNLVIFDYSPTSAKVLIVVDDKTFSFETSGRLILPLRNEFIINYVDKDRKTMLLKVYIDNKVVYTYKIKKDQWKSQIQLSDVRERK